MNMAIPWENNSKLKNNILKAMMIIYKITNIINNKVYIGLTTTSLKYSKRNKVWLLDGKEINIDSFEL